MRNATTAQDIIRLGIKIANEHMTRKDIAAQIPCSPQTISNFMGGAKLGYENQERAEQWLKTKYGKVRLTAVNKIRLSRESRTFRLTIITLFAIYRVRAGRIPVGRTRECTHVSPYEAIAPW
jgi:hypothetical protein